MDSKALVRLFILYAPFKKCLFMDFWAIFVGAFAKPLLEGTFLVVDDQQILHFMANDDVFKDASIDMYEHNLAL